MYIAVTSDKYELPIAVADTSGELAKMLGTTRNNILSSISKNKSGKHSKVRYIKLEDDGVEE